MVCTIWGKHSHFCIGWAQSMHCAMMRHMTAVGHRHVCPTLTNTHLVNPPIKQNFGYPVSPVTKKGGFLANGTNKLGRMSLIISVGSLLLSVQFFSSKAPFSDPPMSCKTLFWPWNCRILVTDLLQTNVELNFDLFFTDFFNGVWGGGGGWQYCGNME